MDCYLQCRRWPEEGQKVNAEPMGRVYGGMIPNAAAIFAGYGTPPLMMGPLQDNTDADPILRELQAAGVDTRMIRRSASFRNSAAYNILSQENPNEKTLIIVDPGYHFELNTDERNALLGARFIYSTIAHLTRIVGIADLMIEARAGGTKLFIDVEAESFLSTEHSWWAFTMADFLSFNEESLAKLCEKRSQEAIFTDILTATNGEIVTTLGKDGCRVTTMDGVVQVGGIPVRSIDPLGAGDTFNATYLFCRAAGWSIERAAKFANAAAARSTTIVGPRSGHVAIPAVEQFLADHESRKAS
ncbi:carbohydrate kinase family protein [Defluviimonas sp. SAOS-178_SWC]|uniref:carbohydrate kinase family protein n=1 Tax=Defluviimonas sp. SAOS-178_SWC TaxID=3121287 RepID=UPI0032215806